MSEPEILNHIVAFAQHLGRGGMDAGRAEATNRRWLDGSGRPTADGLSLLAALEDQRETRTAFRGVA